MRACVLWTDGFLSAKKQTKITHTYKRFSHKHIVGEGGGLGWGNGSWTEGTKHKTKHRCVNEIQLSGHSHRRWHRHNHTDEHPFWARGTTSADSFAHPAIITSPVFRIYKNRRRQNDPAERRGTLALVGRVEQCACYKFQWGCCTRWWGLCGHAAVIVGVGLSENIGIHKEVDQK